MGYDLSDESPPLEDFQAVFVHAPPLVHRVHENR